MTPIRETAHRGLTENMGMLVLRVWSETDGQLRARITDSDDFFSGDQRSLAALGLDEICTVLRSWLELLQRGWYRTGRGGAEVTWR